MCVCACEGMLCVRGSSSASTQEPEVVVVVRMQGKRLARAMGCLLTHSPRA